MLQLDQALSGISGILVTPFDRDDRIAPALQAPIVERAVSAGVHVLVANGNTGEFYALTSDEAERMLVAAVGHVAGRVPLLAGVGRSVNEACALTRVAVRQGAAGIMVHQPPDPFCAPRGVVEYVRRVAGAADGLPVMLYLRNDAIGSEAIADLCAIEGVAGVKWATPNPMRLAEAMRTVAGRPRARGRRDIVWVCGLAEIWAPPLYVVGARGFTSGLINVWPEHSVAIHAALDAGDYGRAGTLIAAMQEFEAIRAEEMNGTNVTGVKSALRLLGHDCGAVRPPSAWPLTEAQQARLSRFLTESGVARF